MDFMDMKKKGKPLSENEKEAKMSVVKAMRDMAAGQMSDKLKGLKKVTVASNDKEGLEAGLEKAKEMISKKAGEGEESESMDDAIDGGHEEENSPDSLESLMGGESESEEMSEDELDAKLKELMALKAKMEARKG